MSEYEKIIEIKNLIRDPQSFTDSEILEKINEILYCNSKEKMLIEIIEYLWTFESTVHDCIFNALINLSNFLNESSSKTIFLEVQKLFGKETLYQRKVIEIIPVLVSNIRRCDDEFSGYIGIKDTNCRYENLVSLIQIMREMNTITLTEKNILIKRLLDILSFVNLSQLAELVHEILLLCDKVNFQYCIGSIINFFNAKPVSCSQLSQSTMTSDSKRMMEIQLSVLNYCYDIAKFDCEFVKEIIKFCKNNNPVFSISGFMCIILLTLSGLQYAKDQILDFLKSSITTCFKDNKLIMESAFIRESVSNQFDMDSLLLNAVKYCCVSNRSIISESLLQLGFLLIKSGLPKSKIVSLKKEVKSKDEVLIGEMSNNDFNMTTSQKVGHAGVQMLIHLFKKLSELRQTILNSILSFILKESHRSAVFIYLELFADLISLMPLEINASIDKFDGQPIFELLCYFPHDVALALVHALLPLVRYSTDIRQKLVTVIMTNILSGREHARRICVESSLVLLKYMRVTIDSVVDEHSQDSQYMSVLTQSSQFACTQISLESRPLHVDNSMNDDICKEILAMIDQCCQQYQDTKTTIYRGLVHVIERNFHFSGQVVLFLLTKLEAVMSTILDNSTNPFLFTKIISSSNLTPSLDEPIGILVSCLAESVRLCKVIMPPLDILSTTNEDSMCITRALDRSETLLNNLLTCLSSQNLEQMNLYRADDASPTSIIIGDQMIDVYEVLLVHFVSAGDVYQDRVKKVFEHREHATRIIRPDKKIHKNGNSSYIVSLSTLTRCLRHLLDPLRVEIKSSHYRMVPPAARTTQARPRPSQRSLHEMSIDATNTNIIVDQNSVNLFLNEKISAYLLSRAITLIKKIGGTENRITNRNREEMCKVLSEVVNISLDYYVACLCVDKVESLTTPQRQIMQNCCILFCASLKKIMQFFSKTIDVFLGLIPFVKEHLTIIQRKSGLVVVDSDEAVLDHGRVSMNVFVTITKAIITRILSLGQKRLYLDIESLLNVTLNVTIFCGLDDIRQTVATNVTYGCARINVSLLHNLYSWLSNLLISSTLRTSHNGNDSTVKVDLQDSHLCRVIVSLSLIIARMVMPDSICFIEKLCTEISGRISSYSMITNDIFNNSFLLIHNPNDIVPDVINALIISLDDTDWLLSKWKAGWLEIKLRKAMSHSQLSNISSNAGNVVENSLDVVIDQDRALVEQLQSVCISITKLIQCSIGSVLRLQELVKITTRFFDQVTLLTKQYATLTKSKLGSFSSEFKKLVMLSGGDLSAQVSLFIVYIQKVEGVTRNINKESGDCDVSEGLFEDEDKGDRKKKKEKNNLNDQMGRTEKEIKLIPNLVFSLEQYQRYLILLQRVSKVDLMKYVSTVNSRDFRIDHLKLQQSLDQNVTIDLSECDDDETLDTEHTVTEVVTEATSSNNQLDPPPRKKARTVPDDNGP